ncbi:hypothetical protein [Streptomyces sp. AK02-04a]|uniref:hypothetical protein n=1 Tax=Streptomyces sp. AK02-04a TaxID=3028649 RepID=UPI0029BC1D7C|nr:hypothetical protein [Streptomyces sp. AK02-04a]MDX3763990.1 hypothetical protein [Streptomyces sp. AK02-04a]
MDLLRLAAAARQFEKQIVKSVALPLPCEMTDHLRAQARIPEAYDAAADTHEQSAGQRLPVERLARVHRHLRRGHGFPQVGGISFFIGLSIADICARSCMSPMNTIASTFLTEKRAAASLFKETDKLGEQKREHE